MRFEAGMRVASFEIFRCQPELVGSHSLNRNIPEALEILARDAGPMARLILHRLPLPELLPFFTKKPGDPATVKVQYVADR